MKPAQDDRAAAQRNVAFILLAGIAIRCWHIGWGLPEIYEEATPFTVAWRCWNWGSQGLDLNPHFFNYPALTFYLNFLLQAAHYGIGHLTGAYPDLSAFARSYVADPTPAIILARLVSVAFDCGTIVVIYMLARTYMHPGAALLPALLAAVNPLMIKNSHLVNVDTPLVFFSALSLFAVIRIFQHSEWKWYLLAGASIGLAASSKYTGALLLPVLVLGHLLQSASWAKAVRSLADVRLLMALGLTVGLFLLINPYTVLSFDEFYRDFSFEESHMAQGHLGIDPRQSTAGFYLLQVLPGVLGWLFLAAIGLGMLFILKRRKGTELLVAVFPVLTIAVIMSWKMRADRYILPALPPLIVIGSIGIMDCGEWLKNRSWEIVERFSAPVSQFVLKALMVLLLIVQPVAADLSYHSSLSLPDTRILAKEWILGNVPKGAVIVTPPFGLVLPDTMYRTFPMPFLSVNPERLAPFYDTRWFDDLDLVVGSDYDYSRYIKDTARYHDFIAYYDSLRSRYTLAYEVVPKDQQPGPIFWLFRPGPVRAPQFDPKLFTRLSNMPESAWVSRFLKNLAILLIEKGKYEKTEQIAHEILSVETTNIEALRMLAAALEKTGRRDEILREIDSILTQFPGNGDVLALKGNILLRAGRDAEAEETLIRSLEMSPASESAYDDLLRIYVNRKDKKNAISVLTKQRSLLDPQSEKVRRIDRDLQMLQTLP